MANNSNMNYEITLETSTSPARVIAQVEDYAMGVIFREALIEDFEQIKSKRLEPDAACIKTESGWAIYRIRVIDDPSNL